MGYSMYDLFSDTVKGCKTIEKDFEGNYYEDYDLDQFLENLFKGADYRSETYVQYLVNSIIHRIAKHRDIDYLVALKYLIIANHEEDIRKIKISVETRDIKKEIDLDWTDDEA